MHYWQGICPCPTTDAWATLFPNSGAAGCQPHVVPVPCSVQRRLIGALSDAADLPSALLAAAASDWPEPAAANTISLTAWL
jgi:hypothetical protein